MKNLSRKSKRSKKNRTQKYIAIGGDDTIMESQSLQELQKIKDDRLQKSNEMTKNATNIAKGVAVNTLDSIGNAIGIDINNPESVNKSLDNIKQMVTDPKNIQKSKEIISGIVNNAAVYFQAAKPLIDPLADKMLDVGSKVAEKAGDTATVVASNFVKEIPGVGLAYSLVQDASKIGEAVSAATNAAAEITTSASDSAVVFKKNLDQLQNEKIEIEKRTMNSLNQFQNPLQNLNTTIGGRNKIRKTKTRRVRFAI
jgi:hypothetical protein